MRTAAAERRRPERGPGPIVLDLSDERCCDPDTAGAKAANLARAAVAGLPVLPGFALTTCSFDPSDPDWRARTLGAEVGAALRDAWTRIADDGRAPLVVRSSSTVEDIGESSMAGQFRSELDVVGWERFLDAVRAVLGSARSAVPGGEVLPMAVLVQRQLDAAVGGVAFGIDPVTGDPQHYMIEAVTGGPDQLVSGVVSARRYVVTHRGRVVESDEGDDPPVLDRNRTRQVARLVHRASRSFDRPQDIEWAFGPDDRLWLLQSRPVTATGELADATGPLLGPGPIAETFPDPIRRLEHDLWIAPLREGIRRAIRLSGVVPSRRLASSPVVTLVGGRVAADLDLLGYTVDRRSGWQLLDPRPGARRLVAAWRVGQIRTVLEGDVALLLRRVDEAMGEVPALTTLDDDQLVGLLDRCTAYLLSVHAHEVMAGTLLRRDDTSRSGAAVALAALAAGRQVGRDDRDLLLRSPVVLALVPPRIGRVPELPTPDPSSAPPIPDLRVGAEHECLGAREALRLRARWLHELSARAAMELAGRLVARRSLPDPSLVVHLSFAELQHAVEGGSLPDDLLERAAVIPLAPLPAAFRRSPGGAIAPVRRRGDHRPGGRGAGGGRAAGRVVHGSDPPPEPGDVLVVRTLSPALAVHLPVVAAIVSETGSVLSHLAILAREYDVPTVVGVHDALHRYPVGAQLLVDGDSGEVTVLAGADEGGASTAVAEPREDPCEV
jgi:pyruvate,water dikinase